MCSPYEGSPYDCTGWPDGIDPTADFVSATTTVTIPDGAVGVVWTFPGDRWGEISFKIYDPDGVLIGDYGPGHPAGILVLCDDDLQT